MARLRTSETHCYKRRVTRDIVGLPERVDFVLKPVNDGKAKAQEEPMARCLIQRWSVGISAPPQAGNLALSD